MSEGSMERGADSYIPIAVAPSPRSASVHTIFVCLEASTNKLVTGGSSYSNLPCPSTRTTAPAQPSELFFSSSIFYCGFTLSRIIESLLHSVEAVGAKWHGDIRNGSSRGLPLRALDFNSNHAELKYRTMFSTFLPGSRSQQDEEKKKKEK